MKHIRIILIAAITAAISVCCSKHTPDQGNKPDTDNPYTPPVVPEGTYEAMKIPAYEEELGALAFPGAEGGGMYTTGGRGGKVLHVTNLNDSGAGSLRAAVEASGARTVVFDVAGTISLKTGLVINNGNITIAGHTAPGDGICIKDNTVCINADNVIVRFVRFRLGNEGTGLSDGSDAFWGRYHKNIIIDHCSVSWSIDEVASFYANCNFTMQWCIISEALRISGIHTKGAHGYGGIWGGKNASFHHNLLAHNDSRNARIDHPGIYIQSSKDYRTEYRGNVDYRNNVIYNWGGNSTYGGEDGHFNIVGNYFKPGPASSRRNYFVDAYWYNSSSKVGSAYPVLYLGGNYHAGDYASSINSNDVNSILWHDQSTYGDNPAHVISSVPHAIVGKDSRNAYTSTHSAADAFTAVLGNAGASLVRDCVDSRLAGEAKEGTATYMQGWTEHTKSVLETINKENNKNYALSANGIIDSQEIVGGWPDLTATAEETAACKDSDRDGIPDWFEEKFGLDRNNASDASLKTIDIKGRYSNLEMYMHYLVRDIVEKQSENSIYTLLQ